MCGRYYIDDGRDSVELQGLLEDLNRRPTAEAVKTSGEIFPADLVPVVASSRRLTPAAFAMRWGYTLPGGKRIINARSETAGDKPLFRDGLRQRRCAVPASRYYEWARAEGQRVRYAIGPEDDGLFYMAGLYRLENGAPVFSILTRAPAADIAFIHDRMPVILPKALVKDWIDPRRSAEDLLAQAVLRLRWEQADQAVQLRLPL